MRAPIFYALVAGAAVAGAVGAWLAGTEEAVRAPAAAAVAEAPLTNPQTEVRTVEPQVPASERPQARPSVDPRVQNFQQRERFEQDVREFFARAPALAAEERASRAQTIAGEITRREAAGEVAAAEALTLRSALIRETVADPAEQMEAIAALQEQYRREGSRKQAQWQARADPEFELYKAREREIVAEVMALTTVPDGLTRDEYLRRRLQSAREQLN